MQKNTYICIASTVLIALFVTMKWLVFAINYNFIVFQSTFIYGILKKLSRVQYFKCCLVDDHKLWLKLPTKNMKISA